MIAAVLLIIAAAQAGGSRPSPSIAPPLPASWATLPMLRYERRPDLPTGLDEFVRDEVAAGRCTVPRGATSLRVDLAVLVDAGAAVRVVPRAMACATVEQFAAGLMSRIARDHVEPESPDGWYRATLDFEWRG